MGYFLDYELFTPCWFCGKTNCNGNHSGPEADRASAQITHFKKGFGHESCNCQVCQGIRERQANRQDKFANKEE